ncbi:MAG: transcription antiterminator [Erysipelotrichaceae bacterium]|nr:transcription antiterminator [Erysipelotrichaceae bacterium]
MKSLFSDSRPANILSVLRKSSVMSLRSLASQLSVSERTVRNDIKEINEQLKNCAVIELDQGKCSLRIFNKEQFQKAYTRLLDTEDLMNSSSTRMKYIFGKLMRAYQPVLTDDLAYEMNVARSTLVADLNKLRKELEPYGLSILGKTSKGLTLQGMETGIRRYVMELFDFIYKDYPMDKEVTEAIESALEHHSFERDVKVSLRRYLTLMLDRFLTGHYVGSLPDTYYTLLNHKNFTFVDRLINRIGNILHVEFPIEEKMYVLLPIIGMRTPTDTDNMNSIELDESIRPLAQQIVQRIHEALQISIDMEQIGEEFLYHLMFMINRLRFHVRVDNPLMEDIQQKYPLAHNMAKIAAGVVEQEYDVKVSDEELGYLASYFGVYLEFNQSTDPAQKIALVCGTGRVTAKLLEAQLKNILDSSTQMDTYSDEQVSPELLNGYDLVLSTVELLFECRRPILYIREIFDEADLRKRLDKVRYWEHSDMNMVDDNWFVMADVLEEDTYFNCNGIHDYQEALNSMIDSLQEKGYVDPGFRQRIWDREAKGSMIFEGNIAIPHTMQTATDSMVLAIGVSKEEMVYQGRTVKAIFLMGLPDTIDNNGDLLIRIYDEIMTIVNEPDRIEKISQADTFAKLLRVLYKRI